MEEVEKLIIGRSAAILFPTLGTQPIPVKIDTGAYGSVLHCEELHFIQNSEGKKVLVATLLNHPTSPEFHHEVRFDAYEEVEVFSSTGHSEKRYRVSLPVELMGLSFVTDFTLTDRSHAVFPVLLGRRSIKKRFIVDVSKKGYSYKTLMSLTSNHKHWVTADQLKEEL